MRELPCSLLCLGVAGSVSVRDQVEGMLIGGRCDSAPLFLGLLGLLGRQLPCSDQFGIFSKAMELARRLGGC